MATQAHLPLQHLHVVLLKKDVKSGKAAIAQGKHPLVQKADSTVLPGGELYYQAPPARDADWREFLVPAFSAQLPAFKAQHASAVLFVPAKKRLFAVTFGHGDAFLSPAAVESDFGLRTALTLCQPESLRAVDYRTIEERTRLARVQLSAEASVSAFRVDTATDLLRGFEARSKDLAVCERLAARWSSLSITARVSIGKLPQTLAKLHNYYSKKSLPQEFAWIENVQRVQDPTVSTALDTELEARLTQGNLDNLRLAIPEIVGVGLKIGARFFEMDGPEFDSDISAYLSSRPRKVRSALEAAKKYHDIVLVDLGTGAEKQRIPVYRCVVAEIEHNGTLFILADGEWFSLDRDYVKEVDAVLGAIATAPHKLPNWPSGQIEGDYNAASCAAWRDAALLDKANVWHGGGHSQIEPADWVTKSLVLGYVKRRDKSSSGLSHLFAQGAVAAVLLNLDASFRKRVAAKIPPSHSAVAAKLRATKFSTDQWTVAYVILGADPGSPTQRLPFFSKVNLRKHIEHLRSMQYKVAIVGIPTA